MNITIAIYDFKSGSIYVKRPFEVIKETSKCYYTEHSRYRKDEMDKPILKSETAYPYIQITMLDASIEVLVAKLSKWFEEMAQSILTMPVHKPIKTKGEEENV